MSNDSLGSAQSAKGKRDRNRAVIASTVGAIIEWYDFGLYSIAAGLVFPALFFPQSDSLAGTINAFIVFAVGYIARPVVLFRRRASGQARHRECGPRSARYR